MKKGLLLLLAALLSAPAYSQMMDAARRKLEAAVRRSEAACSTVTCFQDAVYRKNFRRVEKTLARYADTNRANEFLFSGVELDGQRISLLEYLVVNKHIAEAQNVFDYYYPSAFGGDLRDDPLDNLLEKMALAKGDPARLAFARRILSSPLVVSVSERTFMYAVSQADDAEGFAYMKLLASKRIGGINASRRDEAGYRMPYVFGSDLRDAEDVVNNSLKFERNPEKISWLNKTKDFIRRGYRFGRGL